MVDWTRAFTAASGLASRTLADSAVVEAWERPSALEGLTVGGVAAHLYAAIRRFEVALDEAVADEPVVVDVAGFYGHNRVDGRDDLEAGWHPLIRDDAERRAADGHANVTRRFDALVDRLTSRLPDDDPERLVPVWTVEHGATPLRSYAATRVVELVVHTDDLAVSAGVSDLAVPREAADEVIDLFVDLARHRSGDLEVIRAFARHERATTDSIRVL